MGSVRMVVVAWILSSVSVSVFVSGTRSLRHVIASSKDLSMPDQFSKHIQVQNQKSPSLDGSPSLFLEHHAILKLTALRQVAEYFRQDYEDPIPNTDPSSLPPIPSFP